MIMKNMPHMAQFVYDFYNQKINRLMSQHGGGRQTKAEPLETPPITEEKKEESLETEPVESQGTKMEG
uniref:Uncharacterized protein n=1 Tax=Magallana gigas TaxID=29159 RepID=A0A8W8J0R3_MAGGI